VIRAADAEVTARSPAGDVVLAYIRTQVLAIARYDPLVRRDAPDAVHQMRVATRRARSALQAFGQIIDREATRSLGEELKWLAAELGHARDSEVMLERLTADLAAIPPALVVGPVEVRMTGHFTAELAQAGKAALHALDGPRYLRLRDDLDVLLADPPLTPLAGRKAGKALVRPVRRAARRLQRALAAVPAPEGHAAEDLGTAVDRDTAIHEARKAAKRARYAGEAVASAFGAPASRFSKQMKKLQSVLGGHQDVVIAREQVREIGMNADQAGESAFTYGILFEREDHEARRLRRQARQVWRSASRPRVRGWLG